MKIIKKLFLSIIVMILFFLSSNHRVFAEAGLSEAGRTQYFKINETLGISVLPGSESGSSKDSVNIYKYEDNPDYQGIRGKLCHGKYIFSDDYDGAYFAYEDVYIQGNYIWSESKLVNLENGQVWDYQDMALEGKKLLGNEIFQGEGKINIADLIDRSSAHQGLTEEEIRENLLQERNLTLDNAESFDYGYIKNNYESLDIDNLQDFSCFMYGWFGFLICVPVILIIIVAVVIVKWYRNKNKGRGK